MLPINDPKTIRSWTFYDWANSAYSLVIVSAIFPVYFMHTALNAEGGPILSFLGFQIENSVLFSYCISFTYLIMALVNPFLTAMAERSGQKLNFLKGFCLLGGLASCGLYFFTQETISLSMFLFILAGMGYTGSIVFYNAYLPLIADKDHQDKVSAKGFAMGYVGSVLLMVFNLSMLLKPHWYGNISGGLAARISFLSVGIWWLGFGFYSFRALKEDATKEQTATHPHLFLEGYQTLLRVFKEIRTSTLLTRFLTAFFLYNMGVQTVMYVAAIFAEKELHLPSANLITTILILQLIAIPGALFCAWSAKKIGNASTLMVVVAIWLVICLAAYYINSSTSFYILAAFVGFVMGGSQALSRSTFSKHLPADHHDSAPYFSFYDLADKMAIVLGTFSYGLIESITGSPRNSIMALGVFFVIGFGLLIRYRKMENSIG